MLARSPKSLLSSLRKPAPLLHTSGEAPYTIKLTTQRLLWNIQGGWLAKADPGQVEAGEGILLCDSYGTCYPSYLTLPPVVFA